MKALREVYVAGIGITKWGFYPELEWYDFGSEAILKALKDADMEFTDIEEAFCGSVYQGTGSGHQALNEIGKTGIPIINVENACSSGSSAFRLAYQTVGSGLYDIVLAAGFEKSPRGPIPSTAFRPFELAMGFNVQPANYANEARRYMEDYGATVEDFSRVTVKNRRNGAMNPNARFQQVVTLEEVMNSREIATPLRLLHCCPLADGAAAVILCSKDKLKSKTKVVTVATSILTSALYGDADCQGGAGGGSARVHNPNPVEVSVKQAWEATGYGPEDMDVAQAYDTMSPSELWDVEFLGLCRRGEAPRLLRENGFDINGKIPVNTDGGLMSRGHPLGATALGQIYEVITQLREEAGPRQVQGAKIGLCHSMGAGPNSSVTILKR